MHGGPMLCNIMQVFDGLDTPPGHQNNWDPLAFQQVFGGIAAANALSDVWPDVLRHVVGVLLMDKTLELKRLVWA